MRVLQLIILLSLSTCATLNKRSNVPTYPRVDAAILEEEDTFEREPLIGRFKIAEVDLTLIGIHIKPGKDHVEKELNKLDDTYRYVVGHYQDPDVLIMGDLNADCRYLSNSKEETLDLHKEKLNWLVSDEDTTVNPNTDCSYDRMLSSGNLTLKDSAVETDEIDEELSDHYLISADLVTKTTKAKICSWNIKVFGKKKSSDEDKMGRISDIISQCDIAFIQEVRGELVEPRLVEYLPRTHKIIASPPLGRSSQKEIYFYIYNSSKVAFIESFVGPDGR